VVADLNRGLAQPIELGDMQAKRLRFTGVLVVGPRAAMVRRLTALLPVRSHSGTDGAVVLSTEDP
jgi:ferric-dicitrate binding protein FerR (iron transport regulator)